MYGIFLIIVLVITGGAIAFIGDKLGSKVGKKRLSIFGLRPKHTSILVTIITGIMITSTTLGIMSVVSENVRTALFGMEKLNKEMAEAKEEVANAQKMLEKAKADQETADNALSQVKKDLNALQAQKDELEEKNQMLQEGNELLEQAKEELMERYDILSAANDALLVSQAELKSGNEKLQGDNKKLHSDNEKLAGENSQLESRNKVLGDSMQIMREGEIAFRAGETLASAVIKGNRSEDEIKNEFQKIIDMAQQTAYIKLNQRVGTEIPEEACQIWIYQPDYEAAVNQVSKNNSEYVIRVLAAGNLIRGEAIRTVLQVEKNFLVYEDGELVLRESIKLEGKNSDEREKAIIQFLKDVNDKAIKKGMLPDTLTGAVGVIDGNQIYSAIQKMDYTEGMALLSAYANGSADVRGPLRIRLQVGY